MKRIVFGLLLLSGCHLDLSCQVHPALDSGIADASDCEGSVCEVKDAAPEAPIVEVKHCPDEMVYVNPKLPFVLPSSAKRPGMDAADFAVDFSEVKGPFCIDRYEWPNIQGEFPITGVSAKFAEESCTKIGKRLPRHSEWVIACMGEQQYLFGYGNTWRPGVCNDNKSWRNPNWSLMANPNAWQKEVARLYQGSESGSHKGCDSQWWLANDSQSPDFANEALDMMGNAGEVVWDSQSQWGYVLLGGYWSGVYRSEGISCLYSNRNHRFYDQFPTYEGSFRCLKEITQ